ncbi:hypothetical protein [Nostoc sp. FACHB-190]|uniref:hypothetical protein n=1 Tax=Nostoc sp. FACHB-190 TaxID=2692838 RepID=UPI0016859572|nr:hypothetical protein [Nostoc sp. FACHB-190]MBD2301628.1 hypothetical protein [Nostoc sp. FACHB-190]
MRGGVPTVLQASKNRYIVNHHNHNESDRNSSFNHHNYNESDRISSFNHHNHNESDRISSFNHHNHNVSDRISSTPTPSHPDTPTPFLFLTCLRYFLIPPQLI